MKIKFKINYLKLKDNLKNLIQLYSGQVKIFYHKIFTSQAYNLKMI